ncbi:hypothetical protein FS935_22035 [Metabacillus litoralis]|uniref:Uncharacterized protein n=1 Tax=Metabacillus litoralis TaxID=152268 RepID=A0A5C6VA16_9BACI|nr:hypothetical protein [Metabacillus litoralis]TXC81584.1 hypothetical protein FS935_22035 [Metabacillus litoralis]
MRDLLGYFLIAQAIITGIIVYSIQQLSDSIKASASYMASNEGSLSWGTDFGMPTVALILLFVVTGLGLFLIVNKK